MIPAETLVSRFGRRVRELRNQFGMSQAKLAEGARISTNHVGAIERAEKSSTLDTIEAVARGLRVDPAELLADPPKSAAPADPWAREVLEAAAHVPPHLRPVVIDVLAALARHGTVRGPRRARAAANKRPHSAHPPSPSRIRQRGQ